MARDKEVDTREGVEAPAEEGDEPTQEDVDAAVAAHNEEVAAEIGEPADK